VKSSTPNDWRRILGRWIVRAFVYAAAATARREGTDSPNLELLVSGLLPIVNFRYRGSRRLGILDISQQMKRG
jgi:hypothetical protein